MLTDGDRNWIQGQTDRIHDRLNLLVKEGQDSRKAASEATHKAIEVHEEKYHNPVKTWGILAGIAAVLTVLVEALKWLVKKGI